MILGKLISKFGIRILDISDCFTIPENLKRFAENLDNNTKVRNLFYIITIYKSVNTKLFAVF